jgi:hypothetical protein
LRAHCTSPRGVRLRGPPLGMASEYSMYRPGPMRQMVVKVTYIPARTGSAMDLPSGSLAQSFFPPRFLGSSVQSHGHAANDTGIVRSHKEDSHRPGGSPYPLDVITWLITWCSLPFSPSAGLKRQPEHFLSNDSGEALRLEESSHG